jgi:sigma-E factor negative regulatory protein RseB
MRPRLDARPGRAWDGVPPAAGPVSLLVSTLAVLAGLTATGLAAAGVPPWRASSAAGRPSPAGQIPASAFPGRQRAGARAGAAAGPPRAHSSAAALRLLATAASASASVAYSGVEMVAWWEPRGTTASVADVWHQAGREPAVRPIAPSMEWPAGFREADLAAPAGRVVTAVPGFTPRLARLLAANYVVTLGGQGPVAGRPAVEVTVRRPGGTLAATFWLDRATKLPLRRETYGAGGGLLSEEAFLSLALGHAAALPGQAAQPWDRLTAVQRAALRARGWPLPGRMPGRLSLLGAMQARGPAGPVVHLAYSDGLSAVSVFIQRGTLAPRPRGWSRIVLAGHPVYASDPDDGSVAWPARGFVFTVIAQAPAATLSAVVGALPHGPAQRPGLLSRLRLGVNRLLTWMGLRRNGLQ